MKVLVGPNSYGLEVVFEELAGKYPDLQFEHCGDPPGLSSAIKDTSIYMGWLTREVYLAAERLEWIQSPSSGADHFLSIPELKKGSVLLTSAVGTHGGVLADHAMAMILAFTRGLRELILKQTEKQWYSAVRATSRELRGLTVCIVGFGSSGQQVARRAAGFGMRILATDVADKVKPDYVERLGTAADLDGMIAESDVVVVASPYTLENRGLIGVNQFALMKNTALLIGISRGGIIDQDALLHALRNKHIGGAALDVFDREPLPADSPLWDLENILITPHSAGGTQYEVDAIIDIFKENLARFIAGDLPLLNQVDKERGW